MLDFLLEILAIDSTTGKEELLAEHLIAKHKPEGAKIAVQEIFPGKKNVFFKWGQPKIIFCTHLDTVPPFIPPLRQGKIIFGRGACDAKGQIAVMYETCRQLHQKRYADFGLLLLAGEENGTYGAKQANEWIKGCEYVIVGEPTENKLVKAAKGTMLFAVTIKGKAAHSGYSEKGDDAIAKMCDFFAKLAALKFPKDETLGHTTYNIGLLNSANLSNIVSDLVTCRIFFRTTFKTHGLMISKLANIADADITLHVIHEDPPINFYLIDGFKTDVVAFGSDAPKLNKLGQRLLYGPGSIMTAHSENEQIEIAQLQKAVEDLKLIYRKLSASE